MYLSSLGEISTFVTHEEIETHMNESISELVQAVYDSNGDLIVADYHQSYDILRIEPDGTINTLYLGADLVTLMGLGSMYDIGYPIFIDVDSSDNVYYYAADPMQLIKITPGGTATIHATFGPDTEGRSMAAASNGTTYLFDSDFGNRYIYRISSTGTVTPWLSGDNIENQVGGIAPYITQMDVDGSGNIWAYDTNNNRVLRITSTGTATEEVSAATIDPLTTDPVYGVTYASPTGFVREPGGTILVSFYDTDNILRLNPSNDTGVEILSNEEQVAYLGKGGASFRCMQAVSGSRVYAFNAHSKELLQLDGGLAITSLATSDDFEAADTGVPQMTNFYPSAMTIDDSGLLYIVDDDVMTYNPANGQITHVVHDTALEAVTGNTYTDIRALAVADAGEIYIYDMASDSILKVSIGGSVSTLTSLPASSHVPYMVLGENDAALYATETYSDDLKVIDTSSGVMSAFVTQAEFQAVTGSAFNAWSLAKLPSGNLVLFDEMWTTSDNPERIVEVDYLTGAVTILVDQTDIRAAAVDNYV
jgi:sugar lactone lactonase YvrE